MGRFLLVVVGALGLGATSLFFRSSEPTMAATEGRLWARAGQAVAREIALSGLGDAEARLSQDFAVNHAYLGPASWAAPYQGGSYGVTVEQADSLLVVTSRGTFRGTAHHVRRAYRPQAHVVPPFVRQALLVENHIQISRGSPLHAWAHPPGNANVHTNRNLFVREPATLVTGFGTAAGNLRGQQGTSLPAVFQPNSNPDGLPHAAGGAPRIPIPPVDVTVYRPLATQILPRNHLLSGRVTLGTPEAPAVLYADGNLGTGGPVELDGWGILVVDGNFSIDHSIRTVGDEHRSRVLVVVASNAQVRRDNIDLAGAWVVGGNLQLRQGSRLIDGGFTVRGHYQGAGAVEIAFKELPIQLASLAWPDHIVSRSYREW